MTIEYAGATVTEHRLDNGLRVILARRDTDPAVAVMVWYRVGALHERLEEAGVSHFLEHMMFKGSERFGKGEVDLRTTLLGGTNNAFTTPDHTAYWFEFASDRWETALELEADRMRGLLLDPAEFDAEREVVIEELGMGEDDPWRHVARQVSEALFGRHPYGRPVIGYRDTLRAMTPESMRAFHGRFYAPLNATLVVAGDVDEEAALEAARRHFGSIPGGTTPDQAPRAPLERPRGASRITTHWDDGVARLVVGWPGAALGSDDDYALDVLSTVLTSGKLARLYRRLVVEDGLATSVSTSNDARVEGGGFWLYCEAVEGVDPAAVEGAVDEELARVRDELVSDDELRRAKRLLAASEAFESETVTDVAETLGEYATDLDWRRALEVTARREAVDAEALRDAARRVLDPDARVLAWSLPRTSEGNGA